MTNDEDKNIPASNKSPPGEGDGHASSLSPLLTDLLAAVRAGKFPSSGRFGFLIKRKLIVRDQGQRYVPCDKMEEDYLRDFLGNKVPDAWVRLGPNKQGMKVYDWGGNIQVSCRGQRLPTALKRGPGEKRRRQRKNQKRKQRP